MKIKLFTKLKDSKMNLQKKLKIKILNIIKK